MSLDPATVRRIAKLARIRVDDAQLEALRTDVFHRLQELPLAYHQKHKSGDLTSRLMTDTEQLKNVVVMVSGDIIKQPFTLLSAVGSLIYLAVTNNSAVFVLVMMKPRT